jgi:hypothetical protein
VDRSGRVKGTMTNSKTNSVRIKMSTSSKPKSQAKLDEEKRIKQMKQDKEAELAGK